MRIEQVIGQRMRERREELELSQSQLGALIGERLGRPWSRQTVSAAEQGGRTFAAGDLVTLAHVLHVSVGQLLTPPAGVETIEVAPGVDAPRDFVESALVPALATDNAGEKLMEAWARILNNSRRLFRAAEDIQKDMDLWQQIAMAIAEYDDGEEEASNER